MAYVPVCHVIYIYIVIVLPELVVLFLWAFLFRSVKNVCAFVFSSGMYVSMCVFLCKQIEKGGRERKR